MIGGSPDAASLLDMPGGSNLHGHLHLVAGVDAHARTQLVQQSFRAPFHLSKPYWDGHTLHVQVVNPTAGILEGDRLDLDITVEAGAALLVSTPAAARAFMMRGGQAGCRQRFTTRSGAWTEYLPEPLFPHRDAAYEQHTILDVEPGGELAYWDALAPGRVGRGERWAWRWLRIALDVRYAGEPILRECLDGDGAALAAAAAFHGTPDAFFGTLVLITDRLRADDPVWEAVRAMHGDGRWVGASRLRRGGWAVRIVAANGQGLRDTITELRQCLAAVLPHLGSDLRRV